MATTDTITGISPDLIAELQEAADPAAHGVRDPEAMLRACESMNQIRDEIRRTHGLLNIVVPAIRELRDDEVRWRYAP